MKHFTLRLILVSVVISLLSSHSGMFAATPIKREFRAVWVSTVYCLDWPTYSTGGALQGTSSLIVNTQKLRLRQILDSMKQHRFNVIFFQVRPMSDALYRSSVEPTSSYLTGERGQRATWDPLEYAVEEAHKRGLELHAWVNPYRWAGSATVDWNTPWDQEVKNKGWILSTSSGKILNPGIPEVEEHIVNVCKEIITNYDVDGLVFDDYFYNSGTPENSTAGDWQTYRNSGTSMSMADWRRDNVNRMIKAVYDMVQENKPYVRFGVSPAGVASGGAADVGIDPYVGASDWQYAGIYSDPLAWLNQGSVDYISPQLYWRTNHATNPFGPLTRWWSNTAKHFNRHHYASHSVSSLTNNSTTADWMEYATQVQLSRDYTLDGAPGCVFFRSGFISGPNAKGLGHYLENNKFQSESLVPEITWKDHDTYGTVSDINIEDNTLSWTGLDDEPVKYSVYAIPSDMDYEDALRSDGDGISTEYLLGVSYENSYTIPEEKMSDYGFAVCILDKYGKEYAPQTFDVLGINPVSNDGFALKMSGRILRFTHNAASVQVYDMTGICVAQYRNVDEVELDLPDGIYIVKAKSDSGSLITSKLKIHY